MNDDVRSLPFLTTASIRLGRGRKRRKGEARAYRNHSSNRQLIENRTDKGTLPTVNLRFESDICHLVQPSGASKSVEGLVPIGRSSGVIAFLLNFGLIFRYRQVNETKEF